MWLTNRSPVRPLTYPAARRMLQRANDALGTRWTLHDLRHTAAQRMIDDPHLSLTDVQWVLGHAHLTTTQLYLRARPDEVIAKVLEHHRTRAERPPAPLVPPGADGYPADVLEALLGVGVVADHVDAVAFLPRGARPSRKLVGAHDFITPSLPTPVIARPTVWEASQQSAEEVLAWVETLEAAKLPTARNWRGGLLGGSRCCWTGWVASPASPGSNAGSRQGRTPPGRRCGRICSPTCSRQMANVTTSARPRDRRGRAADPGRRDPTWLRVAVPGTVVESVRPLRTGTRPWGVRQADRPLCGGPADHQHRSACRAGSAVSHPDAQRRSSGRHWPGRLRRGLPGPVRLLRHPALPLVRTLLRAEGILPGDSPPTIHAASRRGQLSIEEMVDGYDVACRPVRDLFVDYLHQRSPGLDYNTIRRLTSKLVLLFWRDLELHHPGIDSLHLTDEIARGWKERLRHIRYGNHRLGQERLDPYDILMSVRAFYADLTHWALEDPGRWAAWAAPSPVDSRDVAGLTKMAKRRRSRMHQRIRELAPLLPQLVDAARTRRHHAAAVARRRDLHPPGDTFTADGVTLRRTALATDPALGGTGRPGVVYATNPDGTGPRRKLTLEADRAFWAWACVEVFRHTGVRIEEMLEITHRSFVSYTLPSTGESSRCCKSRRPRPTRNGSW